MIVLQMMEQQPFHRTQPMNQTQHHHMSTVHHYTMNTSVTSPHQNQQYQHHTDVQQELAGEAPSTQRTIPIIIPTVIYGVFT